MVIILKRVLVTKKSITKFIISTVLFFGLLISSNIFININKLNRQEHLGLINSEIRTANGDTYLFQGIENSLNITDYGNLYEYNQEISLNNQEELDLNYYLDETHDWKASKIETTVSKIQDTRNWINNSEFEAITIYRRDQVIFQNSYTKNYDPGDEANTLTETGATFMRVHFVNSSFERYYDYLYVFNKSMGEQYLVLDGLREDFYSPWIPGDEIIITYESDGLTEWDGYYIDYYEFMNASSNYNVNSESWGFNYESITNGKNYHGSGEIGNASGMWIGLYPELVSSSEYSYDQGAYSELYQNLTVPRGQVQDAYLSFDYYVQNGLETNENYLYFQINNKKVFSMGMRDIIEAGKETWLSTGKIYMDLWINSSNIFESIIHDQELNVSVGIMSGDSVSYSYFEDGYQNVIWFDNITLFLTTIANSTQSDINLKLNNLNLNDNSEWGSSFLNLTGAWESNPIILTINTSSPLLNFELNTTIYGYHDTTSKINQQNVEGVSYQILPNGTIYWEFYHNFYIPTQYYDIEFIVQKPLEWKILYVRDSTLQTIPFEMGESGDSTLKINKSYALYPGWWKIEATSPNYINNSNTMITNQGHIEISEFYSGDSASIKTQINNSNQIPSNLGSTSVELIIYNPEGSIWYQDMEIPLTNGTVEFSEIYFSSLNTTGGVYNYTLFWSNGTALGAGFSNFTVIHESYIKLLKPDEAIEDNKIGGSVGEIIPLRIYLRDYENNFSISGATVSYNWTTGTEYLAEVVSGIYETVLDTSDLGSLGTYEVVINANKIGFNESIFILTINLGEETKLQRLSSDSKIIINKNSTIEFKYYSDVDLEPISNAFVSVNISDPTHYKIQSLPDGVYKIEFSTIFIDDYGIYQLAFTFEADGYETQEYIYQFEIIEPPEPVIVPNYLLIIGLFVAILLGGLFGALSLRSYVILPRQRKKESELLARTQRFKDLRNIQALVIIHRMSGIPLFSHSYSILEKQKKELFSGFIQAITTIGEEIVGKKQEASELKQLRSSESIEKILELDFKYFNCLICDREDLRIVFVLKEKASARLKEQIVNLSLGLILKMSTYLENWDGSLDMFEVITPPIIDEYLELYYKEPFEITKPEVVAKLKKDNELSSMETRVLNVVYSMAKNKESFYLEHILDIIHEDNKDLVIDAIETLIQKKIVIPSI